MTKFTIEFTGRDEMRVHRAGCADLSKGARTLGDNRETVVAEDASSAVIAVLGDESDESTLAGMGYTIADFHFLPCTGKK